MFFLYLYSVIRSMGIQIKISTILTKANDQRYMIDIKKHKLHI